MPRSASGPVGIAPPSHRRARRALPAAGLALALVLGSAGCASADRAGGPAAGPGSDAATDRTTDRATDRIVARVDVTGDGSADTVTYKVLAGDRVRIGVRAADGRTARHVVDTALWPGDGGAWHGAAPVDGVPGAELVIGTSMGAHTPLFTMLSWRAGDLVVQTDPLSSRWEWWVDAFAGGYAGWRRVVRDGEIQMVNTMLFRDRQDGWSGERRRFRWDQGWVPAGRRDVTVRSDRAAARVGGWHVTGLPRWPST